jgi:hypothetical protein
MSGGCRHGIAFDQCYPCNHDGESMFDADAQARLRSLGGPQPGALSVDPEPLTCVDCGAKTDPRRWACDVCGAGLPDEEE